MRWSAVKRRIVRRLRPGPWQARAWARVGAWALVILAMAAGLLVADSTTPRPGSLVVLDRFRVSGPDGQPWWIVRWSWKDLVGESAHTGAHAEREAAVLYGFLAEIMLRRYVR